MASSLSVIGFQASKRVRGAEGAELESAAVSRRSSAIMRCSFPGGL
jgi:hypothetical protein